jgi:hypothetical protein
MTLLLLGNADIRDATTNVLGSVAGFHVMSTIQVANSARSVLILGSPSMDKRGTIPARRNCLFLFDCGRREYAVSERESNLRASPAPVPDNTAMLIIVS